MITTTTTTICLDGQIWINVYMIWPRTGCCLMIVFHERRLWYCDVTEWSMRFISFGWKNHSFFSTWKSQYIDYAIQQYVIKIVCGFLRALQFPPPIKLTATKYNWNIVESGVKHHNPNPKHMHITIYFFWVISTFFKKKIQDYQNHCNIYLYWSNILI